MYPSSEQIKLLSGLTLSNSYRGRLTEDEWQANTSGWWHKPQQFCQYPAPPPSPQVVQELLKGSWRQPITSTCLLTHANCSVYPHHCSQTSPASPSPNTHTHTSIAPLKDTQSLLLKSLTLNKYPHDVLTVSLRCTPQHSPNTTKSLQQTSTKKM